RLMRKHASERSVKVLVPLGILMFLAVTPFAGLAFPSPVNVLWVAFCGVYLMALLTAGIASAAKEKDVSMTARISLVPAVALALVVIHAGLGWGELRELI